MEATFEADWTALMSITFQRAKLATVQSAAFQSCFTSARNRIEVMASLNIYRLIVHSSIYGKNSFYIQYKHMH